MRALILVVLAATAQAKAFKGSDDCLTCEMVDGELVLAVSHNNVSRIPEVQKLPSASPPNRHPFLTCVPVPVPLEPFHLLV